MSIVNLIPASRQMAQRRGRARNWIAATTTYLMIVAGVCSFMNVQGPLEETIDPAQVRALEDENKRRRQNLITQADEIKAVYRRVLASQTVAEQPNWSRLLAVIATNCKLGIVLSECKLSPVDAPAPEDATEAAEASDRPPVGFDLSIAGDALSEQVLAAFILQLENTGIFDRVILQHSSQRMIGETKIMNFSILCRFEPEKS